MKIFYYWILLLSLFFGYTVQAQEALPVYSEYLIDNYYLLHPSVAGATGKGKIRLTAGLSLNPENTPSMQTLGAQYRWKEKLGLGGILFNERNGDYFRRGMYGTLVYHHRFSRDGLDLHQLSFGINGGVIQHGVTQPVNSSTGTRSSELYATLDLGTSYFYSNFFAHFSIKDLFTVKRDLFLSNSFPDRQPKYLLSSGYIFETPGQHWSFEPSLLFQYQDAPPENILDFNFKVYRHFRFGSLFGGVSYRSIFKEVTPISEGLSIVRKNHHTLAPFLGFEFKNLFFGYTYSQQLNYLVPNIVGYHQITLGFNLGQNNSRFGCFIPGGNLRRR